MKRLFIIIAVLAMIAFVIFRYSATYTIKANSKVVYNKKTNESEVIKDIDLVIKFYSDRIIVKDNRLDVQSTYDVFMVLDFFKNSGIPYSTYSIDSSQSMVINHRDNTIEFTKESEVVLFYESNDSEVNFLEETSMRSRIDKDFKDKFEGNIDKILKQYKK